MNHLAVGTSKVKAETVAKFQNTEKKKLEQQKALEPRRKVQLSLKEQLEELVFFFFSFCFCLTHNYSFNRLLKIISSFSQQKKIKKENLSILLDQDIFILIKKMFSFNLIQLGILFH